MMMMPIPMNRRRTGGKFTGQTILLCAVPSSFFCSVSMLERIEHETSYHCATHASWDRAAVFSPWLPPMDKSQEQHTDEQRSYGNRQWAHSWRPWIGNAHVVIGTHPHIINGDGWRRLSIPTKHRCLGQIGKKRLVHREGDQLGVHASRPVAPYRLVQLS